MNPVHGFMTRLAAAGLVLLLVGAAVADDQNARWSDAFRDIPAMSLDGQIVDLVEYRGEIIACGTFTQCAGRDLGGVARWGDDGWQPMGNGIGAANGPWDAFVYRDELYVGSWRWTGSEWVDAFGLDAAIDTADEYDGLLVLGGAFTSANGEPLEHLAVWDGEALHAFGGGTSGRVSDLASYQGDLYVAGSFSHAGGVQADGLARWNGESWQGLGMEIEGTQWACCDDFGMNIPVGRRIVSLGVHDGSLYVGGMFTTVAGLGADAVVRWDGSDWYALSDLPLGDEFATDMGMTPYHHPPEVLGFRSLDDGLLIHGMFTSPLGAAPRGLALWTGGDWSDSLGGPTGAWSRLYPKVWSVLPVGDDLFLGGDFGRVDDELALFAAGRRDGHWSPMRATGGLGLDGHGYDLCEFEGRMVVGGRFSQAGDDSLQNIAVFTGARWEPLGDGLGSSFSWVRDMVEFGGDLIACGRFEREGALVHNVARWEGGAWSMMGTSPDLYEASTVCIHEGELYIAGGRYTQPFSYGKARPVEADPDLGRILVWRNGDWEQVLAMDSAAWTYRIYDLESYGGRLWIGGTFPTAGGEPCGGLTSWDGQDLSVPEGWTEFSTVRDFELHGDELLIGGEFALGPDGGSIGLIAWDGSTWRDFGSDLVNTTSDCGVYGITSLGPRRIVVGGRFSVAGGSGASHNLALWNGDRWHPYGSGLDGTVTDALPFGGDLLVVGETARAGEQPSFGIALWSDVALSLQIREFRAERVGDDVSLSWNMGHEGDLTGYCVERTGQSGTVALTEMPVAGGQYRQSDTTPGRGAFSYALRGLYADGSSLVLARASVPPGPSVPEIVAAPNPFNASVLLTARLPRRTTARLEILDLEGTRIREWARGTADAETWSLSWDGRDAAGRAVASGAYFVRLTFGTETAVTKISLVK